MSTPRDLDAKKPAPLGVPAFLCGSEERILISSLIWSQLKSSTEVADFSEGSISASTTSLVAVQQLSGDMVQKP